eukprot:COSAG02_NODE_1559_length_11928_cov_2.712233_14_plen_244_part_00
MAERLLKAERAALQKSYKTRKYIVVKTIAPCKYCGSELLGKETSALCCMNGNCQIPRKAKTCSGEETRRLDNPQCKHSEQCMKNRDLSKQPRSYDDLKTGPTGILHTSFTECADDFNLMNGHDEYTFVFLEQVDEYNRGGRTPQQLRDFFTLCLLADVQFNAAGLWKDHCELMSQDYHNHIARQGVDPNYGSISAQAERKALADIEAQLTAASRTMHDFGLQSVVDEETPLPLAPIIYGLCLL